MAGAHFVRGWWFFLAIPPHSHSTTLRPGRRQTRHTDGGQATEDPSTVRLRSPQASSLRRCSLRQAQGRQDRRDRQGGQATEDPSTVRLRSPQASSLRRCSGQAGQAGQAGTKGLATNSHEFEPRITRISRMLPRRHEDTNKRRN